MTRVNSSVKFSYNLIKGSLASRKKLVSKLNETFFDSLLPIFKDGKCELKTFRTEYFKILPERKDIKILQIKSCPVYEAASDYLINKNNEIMGLTIEIPIKHNSICDSSMISFMHENTHVLETLTNPKRTCLTQKLTQEGKYNKQRNIWFDDVLYSKEEIDKKSKETILENVKEKTLKFLYGKSNRDKISHLQDARYELEEERTAYEEQIKYAKKLKEMNIPVKESDLVDIDKQCLFTEKIQLLKDITYELILKERKKSALRR